MGVSSGSGGLANRVTSVNEGRKRVSFGFRVFSGSFGVRSEVLCKCSGNVLTGLMLYNETPVDTVPQTTSTCTEALMTLLSLHGGSGGRLGRPGCHYRIYD